MLTHNELIRQLEYNSDTGKLIWKISKSGIKKNKISKSAYERIVINQIEYKAHRVAWFHYYGNWPNGIIDHINGNKRDNRISNLRDVSPSINSQNRQRITGVTFHKPSGKWNIRLIVDGRMKHLGSFLDKLKAEEVCLQLRRIYYEGNTL